MDQRGQSPIDLRTSDISIDDRPVPTYHGLTRATLTDTGTTVSVTVDPGGILIVDSRPYALTEIHSHAPSEHTIRGKRSDFETHFVHRADDDSIAVIGLLFDAHPAPQLIDGLVRPPSKPTEQLAEPVMLSELVPRESHRFRYNGSLTTPPFTEGVRWVVLESVQWVGQAALDAYSERYGTNARALQPIGDRTVRLL